MYEYFKNIIDKSSCQSIGACSIHPSVSALYDIMLGQLREISFYLVKLKEFGITNKKINSKCIETLSIFLINTSFNHQKFLTLVSELQKLKNEIKEKYLHYCAQKQFPCEIINTNIQIDDSTTISQLIKYAQSKQQNQSAAKQRLFEVITIFAKLCAIDIVKIKKFEPDFDKYDFEILRFFALTNGYSIRNEKIIRRIKEFSEINIEIKEKLYKTLEERYGRKESAQILTSTQKGHCILVSGDDLDELEALLTTLEKLDLKEEVNVYTHGPLILAHFYPYFKNNKFLKGHFGSNNAQYDFSIFPGSILITKNFIQKIDTLYKGEIFSNKIISFERVFDIQNNDYKPVVEASLSQNGFLETNKPEVLNVGYEINDIKTILNDFCDKEIVIVTSIINELNFLDEYENKKIINLNCPLENDLLIEAVKKLKEKNVKISVFNSQCNLESLNSVLFLLNKEISLYFVNCSSFLINPHVIESLKQDFDVKII